MSQSLGPSVPLSIMDLDLSRADDTERCRAQLLVYHYVRVAPSLTKDMQKVLTEVLIYDKPWRNATSNVPGDGVSMLEMHSELQTRMYFPYWFVVARIRHEMSKHWGVTLPNHDVIYPGGRTLPDFDAFCGEVGMVNEEYEAEETEEPEEEEYDFARTAETMPDPSTSSTAWEQIAPVAQAPEQTHAIMEAAIEALQKDVWDLKAHLDAVYQNQWRMATDIAELQDHAWAEEHLDEEELLGDDEPLDEEEPLGEDESLDEEERFVQGEGGY